VLASARVAGAPTAEGAALHEKGRGSTPPRRLSREHTSGTRQFMGPQGIEALDVTLTDE
jgi:hypothetical protein